MRLTTLAVAIIMCFLPATDSLKAQPIVERFGPDEFGVGFYLVLLEDRENFCYVEFENGHLALLINGRDFELQRFRGRDVTGHLLHIAGMGLDDFVEIRGKKIAGMQIVFDGFDGNDTFNNSTVNPSTALGGTGNDSLIGGYSLDILRGEGGNDDLQGRGGNDQLFGGPGADQIRGHNGNDWMDGGPGADSMWGGKGNDVLFGSDEWPQIISSSGESFPFPDFQRDILFGGLDADQFHWMYYTTIAVDPDSGQSPFVTLEEDVIGDYSSAEDDSRHARFVPWIPWFPFF